MVDHHRHGGRSGRRPPRHRATANAEPPRPARGPAPGAALTSAGASAGASAEASADYRQHAMLRRFGGDWLYGRHPVAAALANPERRIHHILALPDAADEAQRLCGAAQARLVEGVRPLIVDVDLLGLLLPDDAVHQGLVAAASPLPALDLDDVIEGAAAAPTDDASAAPQIVVLLDQVTDPHNVGAVLRSAAAFGAIALVMPEHGAPPVTGVLAKAASGALEHVPIVRVVNLARSIDRLKTEGFWCVGLDEEGRELLPALSLGPRIALVLGSEGGGMRRLTRERCDLLARLPTSAALGSLNVSNAAAIALYELNRAASLAAAPPAKR